MRWPIKPAAAAYVLLLLAALFLLATQAQRHSLLVTDLAELLPADAQMSTVERNAQAQSEAALNRQMVMLVGAAERENAEAGASALAALWRQSGVFESVTERTQPDMAAWQQAALPLRLALLPAEVAAQWPQQAPAYFRQRAEDMANPFATPALLPPTQDWLGLSRFMLPKIQQSGHLQWDEHSGMLWAEHDGRHWVLVRAELPPNSGVADAQTALLPLLQQTQQAAVAGGQTVQIAGGAVFAAEARAAAERESRWMSMAGVGLTLLLLLAVFRRWRILLLLLPLACGVLLGLAACVAVFGHVHVLTVVIGTSLIGVLIDFPLHWLTPAVLSSQWRARPALRQVLPVFVVSLAVTVSGYALLLFTPLPVLRQTAVFSAVALVGAFAATALLLPPLFSRWQPRSNRRLAGWAQSWQMRLPQWRARVVRYGSLPLLLLALAGLWRSNWHDDIRQWVHLSPQWLAQAQAVGRISGVAPAGQFFLVEAGSEDALLQTDAELSKRLAALPSGSLAGFQSLSQWVLPQAAQRQLQAHMRQMAATPALWAEMSALGVPDEAMRQALLQTAVLPPVSLSGSLNNPLAQAWQPLYLGQVAPGRFVGMVHLNGAPLDNKAPFGGGRALGRQTGAAEYLISPNPQSGGLVEVGVVCAGMAGVDGHAGASARQPSVGGAAGVGGAYGGGAGLAGAAGELVCHVRFAAGVGHWRGLCAVYCHGQTRWPRALNRHAAGGGHHLDFVCAAGLQRHTGGGRLRAGGGHRRGVECVAGHLLAAAH